MNKRWKKTKFSFSYHQNKNSIAEHLYFLNLPNIRSNKAETPKYFRFYASKQMLENLRKKQ